MAGAALAGLAVGGGAALAGAGTATAITAGVTAAGAMASYSGAKTAAKAQDRATQAASKSAKDQLEFNKQQYEDWQRVFGPVEQNLASFYNELNIPDYTAQLNTQAEAAYKAAQNRLERNLDSRGLYNSGIKVRAEKDLANNLAQVKAANQSQARDIVENKKLRFLGLGLNNQGALIGNINRSYGSLIQNQWNQAAIAGQQLQQANAGLSSSLNALGQQLPKILAPQPVPMANNPISSYQPSLAPFNPASTPYLQPSPLENAVWPPLK